MSRFSDVRTLSWPRERDSCGVGFIADLHGRPNHRIIKLAVGALANLAHRGAVSADGRTGDGAGVLTQLPYRLLQRELGAAGLKVAGRDLALGVFFIENSAPWERIVGEIDAEIGASALQHLMWRDPPIDLEVLGDRARQRCPLVKQLILGRPEGLDDDAFERLLFLTRKRIEARLTSADLGRVYVPSLSSRTVCYKGLMVADQLTSFYHDLSDPDYETAIALFHQRYSTNTTPTWFLAQPFRFLAHNGEINTLQGNVNFMRSREPVLASEVWGEDIRDLLPIIAPESSDSAALDSAFELIHLSGRDLIHTLMMLVPEAFEGNPENDPDLQGFYQYHAALMEPWDGPAALALTDGRYAVAALDRNGLRPQRYWITDDDLVIVGSEVGLIPVAVERVIERGRLGPGMMLAVDTAEGRILKDRELKGRYARRRPYRAWVESNLVRPSHPPADPVAERGWELKALRRVQKVFGYGREDYDRIFEPMVFDGTIPIGSMGDDTPLAVLSEQPQLLYRYFKQRFAQVTNPPIDPYRERLVMSLETVLGPRGQLLDEQPAAAKLIKFDSPIIGEAEFAWLKAQDTFKPVLLQARFPVSAGPEGLESRLEELRDAAEASVRSGSGLIILSDREIGPEWAPIPMFLAASAVHHRLLEVGLRTRTAIVCDTGEPREDHHYACLIGYGVALIHPYLAFATARDVPDKSRREEIITPEESVRNYIQAIEEGLLKIMSKMGISALSSYRGAQIFEAVGVDRSVIDRYFTGTPSRIAGVGLEAFGTDALRFHAEAYGEDDKLRDRGVYRFRKAGEYHALNPMVFKALHKAVRRESFEDFEEYVGHVDNGPVSALRDLITYKRAGAPLALTQVEPVEGIVRRFTTQAMSHGSVSRETHETLSVAMNRLGAKSNSGEGGEDPVRFRPYERDRPDLSEADWHPREGDWGNSAIKQVASGRFGVTPDYLVSASELEIKMAQGSKPGEGGQIPGHKVSDEIARIRRSVPGVTLISPPPHHDIYSIEDLAQLIYDLKRVNRRARVGVKLVAIAGVGTIAAGVAKGYADTIQISGHEGGTGASPLSSVKHAGVPWELGLAETQQVLVEHDLRSRVTLRVDGGLKTGRDVVISALLGAEAFGFGTAALVAAGCAMIRQCHLNTCPVGVATQRSELREKYPGTPEHVIRFFTYVAQQVRMILAEMGVASLDDIVGRVDLLVPRKLDLPKAISIDLSAILRDPDPGGTRPRRSQQERNDRPEPMVPLDEQLLEDARDAIRSGDRVDLAYRISNSERTVGARLSGEIARFHGGAGLKAGTVNVTFTGVAGQSFGAFNNRGVNLSLIGEAQDYVGKGMYGGEIVVSAPPGGRGSDVLVGNTVLYGATGGTLFVAGRAGERLAVRNSGGRAVVEGCGDHGCEYMTGGIVVLLGATGRNFGAGMSGGVAYLLDEDGQLQARVNTGMVEVQRSLGRVDDALLRLLVGRHEALTGSPQAAALLSDWERARGRFCKVVPRVEGAEASDAAGRRDREAAVLRSFLVEMEQASWLDGS
ncbi:MAG: glutamate synthase large subunit [Truepera sp.]|nr:glutamate synthase large subunit [Truepera sp.]